MKNLIIGGAGFIGAHLARALASAGESVDVIDNFSRGVRDAFLAELESRRGVNLIHGDILDERFSIGDDYDMIYQFAAIIGVRHVTERPFDVLNVNVAIQARAIDVARRQRALRRFIFTSTSEVYAGSLLHLRLPVPTPEDVPLALTDLTHPRTSYMLSKIYGEAMCHHSGVPFTIVRPHNVYGPRMGMVHVLPELMKKALDLPHGGKLEVASVDHRRSFCYIDDAIELLRRLAVSPEGERRVFNLGNQEEEVTIGQVAQQVLRTVNRPDLEVVAGPATPGSPARRCPDMTRAVAAAGFRPVVDLAEGMQRTYRWYHENVFAAGGVSAT